MPASICVTCQRDRCGGCSSESSFGPANLTIRHFRPQTSIGQDVRRTSRHRDSVTGASLPKISESMLSVSSTPSMSGGRLRCGSPASLCSLSSIGSSTYSSSLSSIDDLDEPLTRSRSSSGHSILSKTSGSDNEGGRRKRRRVSFHPNVLLWTAVQQGDFIELVQILSRTSLSGDSSASDRLAVDVANHQGITPLHLCCFAGAEECARLLLLHGATADCSDDDGWTPLHAAAVGGHSIIVSYLARAGANLHRSDVFGRTALDVATHSSTRLLLQRLAANPKPTSAPPRRHIPTITTTIVCTDV